MAAAGVTALPLLGTEPPGDVEPSNKRMEPSGAYRSSGSGALCRDGHELSFNNRARGARVARGSCAVR